MPGLIGGLRAQLTFSIGPAMSTYEQGDAFCLNVEVQDFTDLLSMQFSINYDAAFLTYTGSQGFNLPGLSANDIAMIGAGNIGISWLSPDLSNGTSVADGTSIFQVCFEAMALEGGTVVAFSGSPLVVEVSDVNGNLITPVLENGSVTIEAGSVSDPIFILPDTAVYQGYNVCLEIRVQSFVSITGVQFSINYDTSLLSYTNVQGFNLPGLEPDDMSLVSPGNIGVVWFSPDPLNGTTVPDHTNIFQICFDVIGAGYSVADVVFSDEPVAQEVITGIGDMLDVVWDSGSVTILADGGASDLGFSLPGVSVNPGDTICLAVSTQGFEGIVSTQYSINYDTTLLDYVNSQAYNLPNFGASNIGEPFPGQLTISWLSDDVINGTTVSDSTELFELCFEVIGSNDTAFVNFSEIPVVIEVSDANGELVVPTFVTGMVYISMGVGTNALENAAFSFLPLAPNPARGLSYLRFELQEEMDVQWRISSLDGRVLMQEGSHLPKGRHEIPLNRSLFPSAGTYVVELTAGDYYGTRLLLFTR